MSAPVERGLVPEKSVGSLLSDRDVVNVCVVIFFSPWFYHTFLLAAVFSGKRAAVAAFPV
ncbi:MULTISPECIES: hypothetical protein [Pantoea]|uniref:hypothetical protein n=1 Tax=Pantoea TaxID=53335 RepID=UPI0023033E47|nr:MULTISPECIES: hypothetical protein [Pantoea]WGK59256.1 hypothetical protein PO881_08515 [Pantoea sp. SS70]